MEKGYRRLVANHEATGYKAIRENEGKNHRVRSSCRIS